VSRNRKPNLIERAVQAKLFKSLRFDRLFDSDPLYEATNSKGMIHLSWAKSVGVPIQWKPVQIRRRDGLYRPPLTKFKLEGRSPELQRHDSGHRVVKALASLPKLNRCHLLLCYKDGEDVDALSFGIVASPRTIRAYVEEPEDPEWGTSDRDFPYLWGDIIKDWIEGQITSKQVKAASPLTAWDRVLDEDLFPHSQR